MAAAFSNLVAGRATGGACSCGAGRPDSKRRAPASAILKSAFERTCFMTKPVPPPPPGFDELSVDEKIDYLQSLWDRIAATPETVPVPDWHREIIDERLKDLATDPNAGDSWDTVQERLRKKFESRQ
jgi:putative addiction module component (TIGR02574 family)